MIFELNPWWPELLTNERMRRGMETIGTAILWLEIVRMSGLAQKDHLLLRKPGV